MKKTMLAVLLVLSSMLPSFAIVPVPGGQDTAVLYLDATGGQTTVAFTKDPYTNVDKTLTPYNDANPGVTNSLVQNPNSEDTTREDTTRYEFSVYVSARVTASSSVNMTVSFGSLQNADNTESVKLNGFKGFPGSTVVSSSGESDGTIEFQIDKKDGDGYVWAASEKLTLFVYESDYLAASPDKYTADVTLTFSAGQS